MIERDRHQRRLRPTSDDLLPDAHERGTDSAKVIVGKRCGELLLDTSEIDRRRLRNRSSPSGVNTAKADRASAGFACRPTSPRRQLVDDAADSRSAQHDPLGQFGHGQLPIGRGGQLATRRTTQAAAPRGREAAGRGSAPAPHAPGVARPTRRRPTSSAMPAGDRPFATWARGRPSGRARRRFGRIG